MIDNEAIENLNDEQILNLYDDILQFKENKFLSDICPTGYFGCACVGGYVNGYTTCIKDDCSTSWLSGRSVGYCRLTYYTPNYSVFENVYMNVDGTKGENICTIICETKGLKF